MATTGEIKIKELEQILSDIVTDNDLMVIEKTNSTNSISIGDLKIIFSADKKIIAIQEELSETISKQREELDKIIKSISDNIELDETQLKELSDYVDQNKMQMMEVQKNIKDIQQVLAEYQTVIDTIEDTLQEYGLAISDQETRLQSAEGTINNHTETLQELRQDVDNHKTRLDELKTNYDDYTDNNNLEIKELKKKDSDNLIAAKKYADEKYDDVMKYIDYYHHYTETPPNFDEPFYYERELAGYVYPIHSLYHTTIKDWNPLNYKVPGTWILRSTVTLNSDDNIVEYIYERIE